VYAVRKYMMGIYVCNSFEGKFEKTEFIDTVAKCGEVDHFIASGLRSLS